jgi:S-(hydroxymethyl)glutathione dehydrogenase/alcohol dehydrogenase
MQTEAALLVELGRPLGLGVLELPALRPGQAIVEIAFSGVCHTQLLEARGRRGADAFLPHCLGHEGSGTVLETGPGVTKVRAGDRVVLSWIKGGGANVPGSVYRWGERTVNAGAVTTFQRITVASENRLTPLAGGLPLRDAALLGCALPTGMGAVLKTGAANSGESVAIFGAGGIGQCAVRGAVVARCAPIVAVDPNPLKRSLALLAGATHAIDPSAADPVAELRALTGGGVDLAIEATGLPAVMRQALESVRAQGGRAVVVGNAAHGKTLELDPRAFNDGKSLLGCWGGGVDPDRDIPEFAALIADGRLDVTALLSASYSLADVNVALADLEAGRTARPLIDMSLV